MGGHILIFISYDPLGWDGMGWRETLRKDIEEKRGREYIINDRSLPSRPNVNIVKGKRKERKIFPTD